MNILIAINENYIEPAKTMLFSLACQQEEHLVVYLLQSSIRQEKLDDLQAFVGTKCHGELVDVRIDKALFSNVPKAKWWTEETYYRLISFAILPECVERILWLDADIIVKGNISELYNQDFEGNYIVACDVDDEDPHQRLGLCKEHKYFNAGVILYNLSLIRKNFRIQDIFNCIETHRNHLNALDQDVLNVLFENRVKYEDASIYNHGIFGFYLLTGRQMEAVRNQAKIIHYIGSMKPWNPKGANWADGYWWKYELKRGDRGSAFAQYLLRNLPVKVYHCLREVYYSISGVILSRVKFMKK